MPDQLGQDASSEAPVGQDAVEVNEKQESTQASASNSVAVSFKEGDSLNWPVEGSILLDYSMDSTTYFATLDQYKYNPALLIQSDVGTDVCAAASGIVESITETDETGITVTMDIGGGYQSCVWTAFRSKLWNGSLYRKRLISWNSCFTDKILHS